MVTKAGDLQRRPGLETEPAPKQVLKNDCRRQRRSQDHATPQKCSATHTW